MDYGWLYIVGYLIFTAYVDYLFVCRLSRDWYNFIVRVVTRPWSTRTAVTTGHDNGHFHTAPGRVHTIADGTTTTTTLLGGKHPRHKKAMVPMFNGPASTSKFRVQWVFRRTNPLYWRDPLVCLMEYRAASRIVSPGRTFVPKGRVLSTIQEERRVHFSEDVVSSTHIVPRDALDEIARGRGRRFGGSKKYKRISPGRSFLPALSTIAEEQQEEPLVDDVVFSQNMGDETADDMDETEDMDWEPTPHPFLDFVDDDSFWTTTRTTTTQEVHDDNQTVVDAESVSEEVPIDTTTSQVLSGTHFVTPPPGKTKTCNGTSGSDMVDEAATVLVPTLRRSQRLAEMKRRQEQQVHQQGQVPECLGSTFVNGRRRSSRHLHKNVEVVV